MKGISPVISIILLLLMAVAATGGYTLYVTGVGESSITAYEKHIFYPQNPPVLQALHCFPGYGWFDVMDSGTSGIEGTIIYTISGDLSKTDNQVVNISTFGKIYFGLPGQVGDTINVRLYTPRWEVSERCTIREDTYLRLYLPMDEGSGLTTVDVSSNSNDGTLTGNNSGTIYGGVDGTITGATWMSGKKNGALYFDGVDDYVEIPFDDSLNITESFTIDFWMEVKGLSDNRFVDSDAGFEGGAFGAGFFSYVQTNSSADVVSYESYSGTYSGHFHRDGPEMYPGQCYDTVNESRLACSWNGTHCLCTSGNYLLGESFTGVDRNSVMWGGLLFGSGVAADSAGSKLSMEPNHFYIYSYYFKKNITTSITRSYICYSSGWCDMGLGYPVVYFTEALPSSEYSEWTHYEEGELFPSEMFDGCDGGTCLRTITLVQHTYANVHEGEDIFIDNLRFVESGAISKNGSFGIYATETSLYGLVNDQKLETNIVPGWNRITMTYDKSQITLYVNGTEVDSVAYTDDVWNSDGSIYLGKFLNGKLDDVKIYKKALNSTELQQLFADEYENQGLVGYWKFDEGSGTTAVDSHMFVSGKYGNAVNFDGDGDYVLFSDDESFNISEEITISAWIFPQDLTKNQAIVSKDRDCCDSPGKGGYSLKITGAGALQGCILRNSTTTLFCLSSSGLVENKWQHTIMTFDGSNIRMYIDNSQVGISSTISDTIQLSSKDLTVGTLSYNAPSYYKYDGLIDDVRIYDRAINSTEVTQLYQGIDVRDDLVSYWAFDETSGTSADDSHMWTTGKGGSAINFDGVNDYITVENSAVHNITGPFTISTFVKFSENSGGATTLLIKGSLNPRYDNYLLYMDPANDYLRFFIGMCNATYPPYANIISPIEEGRWYHIAAVYNGTHSLTYADGQFVDSTEIYYTPCKSAEPVLIGYKWTSYFSGMMDDFRIYNKALSQEAINALYKAYD